MDEPTEGLAPVIVAQVEEMLVRLGAESDIAILVIEQNIGVATSVSDKVAIMVNGRINRIIEFAPLAADRESPAAPARRRPPFRRGAGAGDGSAARRARPRRRRARRPGAGAGEDLHLQPDPADALVAAGSERAHRSRARALPRSARPAIEEAAERRRARR